MLEAAAVAAGRDPLFIRQPEITSRVAAVFRSHVARRARGEPLAYVLGEASFRGLDLIVTSDVLIPRPETEQLVELTLERLPASRPARVLDQGTGSGAIAVAIAVARPLARVVAVDLSESAVAIATRNAARHGVADRIEIMVGDLAPERTDRFDLVVANLPYVPDDAILPPDVLDWEPPLALRGGREGLDLIERSIALAPELLLEGGTLLYEIGEEQAPLIEARYPKRFAFKKDLAGKTRFAIG
jgi:release factor glutamine methyltransferase